MLFDHKAVRLSSRHNNMTKKQTIKDTILGDEDLYNRIKCQVIEHYLQHAQTGEVFTIEIRQDLLLTIGQIVSKHEDIRKVLTDTALGLNNDNDHETVHRLREDITRLFENLPRLDYFESLVLTCDDKSFFETLLMTVKNTALSVQNSFYKIKAMSKEKL
jgi:hypothetical protein